MYDKVDHLRAQRVNSIIRNSARTKKTKEDLSNNRADHNQDRKSNERNESRNHNESNDKNDVEESIRSSISGESKEHREKKENKRINYLKHPQSIISEIDKYMFERDKNFKPIPFIVDKHFSMAFFIELQFFDLPRPEPEHPHLVKELLPAFNQRALKKQETKKRSELRERGTLAESVKDFNKRKANEISLKLHLGAKEKIQVTELGAITTPASLKLSSLQSVAYIYIENERTRKNIRYP